MPIDLGIALCLAGARLDSGALLSTMMAMRGGDKYEREHRALIPIRAYRELAALRNRWGAGGESCAATGRDTPVGRKRPADREGRRRAQFIQKAAIAVVEAIIEFPEGRQQCHVSLPWPGRHVFRTAIPLIV